MGTIADKLQKLLSTKEAIKQAIINKGVSVSDADTFSSYASKIQQIESGGGTGGSEDWEITDCSHLFRDAARLECFDKIASHIKNPTNFYHMFSQNSSSTIKKEIDMSQLGNTSAVTSCERMFNNCAYITKITNFGDLSSCTKANYMFYGCDDLVDLDLSKAKFDSVVSASNMFYGCRALTEIDVTLPAVEDISYIFYNCSFIEKVNLKGIFENGTVTNMNYAFGVCYNIKELDFAECDMSSVANMSNAFVRANALKSILNLDLSGVTSTSYLNFFGSYDNSVKNITFKQGTTFGISTQSSEIILNLTRATTFDANGYVTMMSTLGANNSKYVRTIKLNTTLYNALTDEQKALATNKNYNLSYGTS